MRCDDAREALSARLDGEQLPVPEAALAAHVDACPGCAAWVEAATAASRRVRVRLAEPAGETPHDLSAGVRRRLQADAARGGPPWSRLALAALAVSQILLGLPTLLGGLDGASQHLAREVGVTEVALSLGVLAAAWRPWRAAGMLPVVVALAAGLAATAAVDMVVDGVPPHHELPHLVPVLEALLLWRVRHHAVPPTGSSGRAPVALRRVA